MNIQESINRAEVGIVFPGTRWTLLRLEKTGRHPKWIAKCQCGKEKSIFLENVKRGKSISCGCFRKEEMSKRMTTHGQTGKTNTYRSWSHLKGRCINQLDAAYKDYGGRGILVCDRWMKFENFYSDMGDCPPKHSIERVDVNGNYEPSNCIWIHKKYQARNTRATRFNEKEIESIRNRLHLGEKISVIALEYGTTQSHIRQIRSYEIWKI